MVAVNNIKVDIVVVNNIKVDMVLVNSINIIVVLLLKKHLPRSNNVTKIVTNHSLAAKGPRRDDRSEGEG
ncbi:hypothetical protein R6Q57_004461 [Mikania cordata]